MDESTRATLQQVQSHLAAAGTLLAGLPGLRPVGAILLLVEKAQAALKKLLADKP